MAWQHFAFLKRPTSKPYFQKRQGNLYNLVKATAAL